MIGWIVRIFLVLAGFITSFFISRDALNFSLLETIVAVFLFTLFVMVLAFWPAITKTFKKK